MYSEVVRTEYLDNILNGRHKPVSTLVDEYGSVLHIIVDDGCYVLKLNGENTSYIFPEAFEVLRTLSSL